MTQYLCPDCGLMLTDQGLFGDREAHFHRRFRCDNDECEWKGTSYPEPTLIRRLSFTNGGDAA